MDKGEVATYRQQRADNKVALEPIAARQSLCKRQMMVLRHISTLPPADMASPAHLT